jgi:hypothetical protein
LWGLYDILHMGYVGYMGYIIGVIKEEGGRHERGGGWSKE